MDAAGFFLGDERFVPFEDERNNAKMVHDILLNHVPVSANQIHPMQRIFHPMQPLSIMRKY